MRIDDIATLVIAADRRWKKSNPYIWNLLLFFFSDFAHNVIKKFEGKRPDGGLENGLAARQGLADKYNNHTKEARRAGREKLVHTRVEPGQNPDDLFFVLDECR